MTKKKPALKVVRCKKHLLGTSITVLAKRDASAYFGSFLGDREFYLDEGYELKILVHGRDWEKGDRLSMSELVSNAWDWSNIPWDWSY